jgi:glycosyltransferase involved in cell wall biosynthesis
MKVVFSSQFRDSSGYASAARSYLHAIDSVIDDYDIDFSILSISVESVSKISKDEEDLIQKYEINLDKVDSMLSGDVLLIWHQPAGMILFGDQNLSSDPHWQAFKNLLENATKNINMTVWESNKIPDLWSSIHKRFKTKSTIVPCSWNQKVFSSEGLRSHLLPHVVSDKTVSPEEFRNFPVNLDEYFTVFSMSQWIHRKGFDALVKAFAMEFNNTPNAIMIIKTYVSAMNLNQFGFNKQSEMVRDNIMSNKNMVLKHGKVSNAKIIPICDILPYNKISWLYSKSDVFALATRGEGFGLTISEAIMHEKPVIVPDKGGHMDYVDPNSNFIFKSYESPYLGDPGYDYDMTWREPDLIDLRKKLRDSYNCWKENSLEKRGKTSKEFLHGYDSDSIGHKFMDIINGELKMPDSLKERIISTSSNSRKINDLKNSFKDKECYILTCGPSLNQYSPDFLREKLKDKLVIAVKQAYNYVPEIVDFHLFNSNNCEIYDYSKNRPVVITCAAEQELSMVHSVWSNKQEYDIFTFIEDDKDFSKSICKSHNFEEFVFDNKMERPWGPGMMSELVIYLALHLGVSEINTIGWDLEEPGSTKSNHYYKNRNVTRPADPMKQEEIILNIKMTEHLNKWLEGKGVKLYIANDKSYVDKSISRRLLK